MPGLVSTLLYQMYSAPVRLVQTCLQGMLQVWQPRHLSRFITMANWALIFITNFLGFSHHDHGIALRTCGAVIVEGVTELGITADHVGRLHKDTGQAVVHAAPFPGNPGQWYVHRPFIGVIQEGLP